MMKILFFLSPCLVLAACSSSTPPPPKAPEIAQARVVVIEITDTHPGAPPRVATIPLALVEERGVSQYEAANKSEKLKVEAVADKKGPASVVQVKVYRWRTTDKRDGSSELAFSERAVWHSGARTVLGTTPTDDGGATEVAFTMK